MDASDDLLGDRDVPGPVDVATCEQRWRVSVGALHLWLSYLLLAGAGLGALWSAYRWFGNAGFSAQDAQLSLALVAGMYLQGGLGALLFLLSPRYLPIPAHPLIGTGALALAHWGHGNDGTSPGQRHFRRAWTFLAAGALLGLILVMR